MKGANIPINWASGLVPVAIVMVLLTGCGSTVIGSSAPAMDATDSLPGDFTGSGPGTLQTATDLPTIDRRVSSVASVSAKVVYTSTSGVDGTETSVSGTVFAPMGTAPAGGWPIIAYGHGTTGVQEPCAPSLDPGLLGTSPVVAGLLKAGNVVTVSDYQGLGLDGSYHPYLDSTTAGYNLIDSVRAARKLIPDASSKWLAFGQSQGGQAAWAANELSGRYGAGLDLVGSASLVPAADMTGLAFAAEAGTLTRDQMPLLQWILLWLKQAHPDLNLDDYRRGVVEEKWDVLSACSGPLINQRTDVVDQITPDDLRPATPEATATLAEYLQQMSVPRVKADAPMLVIYGGKDTLVSEPWTTDAIARGCRLGDAMQTILQPDAGHATVDAEATYGWINARFAGLPMQSFCPPEGAESGNG